MVIYKKKFFHKISLFFRICFVLNVLFKYILRIMHLCCIIPQRLISFYVFVIYGSLYLYLQIKYFGFFLEWSELYVFNKSRTANVFLKKHAFDISFSTWVNFVSMPNFFIGSVLEYFKLKNLSLRNEIRYLYFTVQIAS